MEDNTGKVRLRSAISRTNTTMGAVTVIVASPARFTTRNTSRAAQKVLARATLKAASQVTLTCQGVYVFEEGLTTLFKLDLATRSITLI